MNLSRLVPLLAASGFLSSIPASAAEPTKDQIAFFESKVRPILADKCYKCHSLEKNKTKGALTLDTAEGVRKGGEDGAIIVPGDPAKSILIKAVSYTDPDLAMPPNKDGGKKLEDAEIAALTEWVKMGAPDPRTGVVKRFAAESKEHWAFKPVQKPAVPQVKNVAWASNPVDSFILAKLEAGKLQPSPVSTSATRASKFTMPRCRIAIRPMRSFYMSGCNAKAFCFAIANA